jgi:ribosome-interacting GTPase 1
MYLVKVTSRASHKTNPSIKYKKKYLTGIYVPEGENAPTSTIVKDVKEFLTENLSVNSDVALSFDVSVERKRIDFSMNKKKQ